MKAVSFIDLNPLGAWKLSKGENKQSLVMRWQPRCEEQCHRLQRGGGDFNFHLSFFNILHQMH